MKVLAWLLLVFAWSLAVADQGPAASIMIALALVLEWK